MAVRDDCECVRDMPRVYLAHVLSCMKRWGCMVNAVWQRLDDPYVRPETQRYLQRDSGYALINLYFRRSTWASIVTRPSTLETCNA